MTSGQEDCIDLYPSYCKKWISYCNNAVMKEERCRLSCNTCHPPSTRKAQTCRSNSTLSQDRIKVFQENSASFAMELYNQARAMDSIGNIFFSPASISVALGMVLAGARGSTRDQIKEKFVNALQNHEVPSAFSWLMQEINTNEALYKLYTVNYIYAQQDMSLELKFSEIVAYCFNSSTHLRDFRTNFEAVRLEVNDWVEEKTNGTIEDFIPEDKVDATTRMILVNAIYFKAEWMFPFTVDARVFKSNFYPLTDPQNGRETDFMSKRIWGVPYFENDDLQILELPYKENELAMAIILPRERTGLPALEASLTAERLKELSNLQRHWVKVTIPRWKMTQNFPLKDILESMGMEQMFNCSADFSGITGSKDLYFSEAIHKAFIEVNEKGTEASAATGFVGAPRCCSRNPRRSFFANRSFLFLIRHVKTNAFLFIGSLTSI